MRLGGPQSRSGLYGEVKICYPTGIRTSILPDRPARSQSLYRLSYPGSYLLSVLILNQNSMIKEGTFRALGSLSQNKILSSNSALPNACYITANGGIGVKV
jgi:hypothetical protein